MEDFVIQEEIREIIEEIDVSDSNYEKATNRYNSIANYIKESSLSSSSPDIYLQGSFKLGTAIRPLTKEGSYDIDIVCNLAKLRRGNQSQCSLKCNLGEVVKEYAQTHSMSNEPEESKRCWTLKYVDEDNFHIDILPSAPLHEKEEEYIAITDTTKSNYNDISYNWETSNPKGYAQWFRYISEYSSYREKIAKEFYASIEKVPEYRVKTPLQRVVQILKRHAEVLFEDDVEHKPSSIIITTLAAKQYKVARYLNHDLLGVMTYIIEHLKDGIDICEGNPCVYNPANNAEVLSGKWDNDSSYFEAFEKWLMQLESDFNIRNKDLKYMDKIQCIKRSLFKNNGKHYPIVNVDSIRHHQKSKWRECLSKDISIKAKYLRNGFRWKEIKSGAALNKHGELRFEVQAEGVKGYEIWWQVTNTGKEAKMANALRGDFYNSELAEGRKVRKENTLYIGRHYVEAYLVKNNICYGKSSPFEVNIVDGFLLDTIKKQIVLGTTTKN